MNKGPLGCLNTAITKQNKHKSMKGALYWIKMRSDV